MAIQEAKRGAGFVSPNPMVGCVILDRDGHFLAKGFHARLGEAHAETNALAEIDNAGWLDGAQVFVTLEPCAHQGRTPSCARALAKLPIASVTYGLRDPNPLVSGRGAEIISEAGIRVEQFQHPQIQIELEELAEIFLTNMRDRRPFVALKVATSLDGKVALADGTSQWITGETARQQVQYLRGCYDAVLTGAGTFLRDDPRLNSRHPAFADKPQRVVMLDPDGQSYASLKASALVKARSAEDIWIVTGPGIDKPPVGQQIVVTDLDRDFDLNDVLDQLQQAGIYSVFVEGGPRTASSFLKARLIDRLYLFMAPKLIGEGMSWTSELHMPSLKDAIDLKNVRIENFAEDILITGLL